MTRLGIVAALRSEISPLTRKAVVPGAVVAISPNVSLVLSGMGPERARAAGQALLAHGVEALLSWGTAGALAPEMTAGQLLVAETVVDSQLQPYSANVALRQQFLARLPSSVAVDAGPLCESNEVLASAADKQQLFQRTGCRAVDMESAALAQLAQESDVAFLAVRVIVDNAGQALPVGVLGALDEYGGVSLGGLFKALLARPQDVPGLVTLARNFHAARRTLQHVAQYVTHGSDATGRPQPLEPRS